MGFPNFDLQLQKIFISGIREAQTNPAIVQDLFEDLDGVERGRIQQYLNTITVTDDVRQHREGQTFAYVLANFPILSVPFPQIGVSLGTEEEAARGLRDHTGDTVPVTDREGTVVGYDQERGYLAHAACNIDVVCATKPEAIWLARICQRCIYAAQDALSELGIMEVSVSAADLKLEAQQTMQPQEIFNRRLRVTAKQANTWKTRLPPKGVYETGINTAL